MLILTFGGVCFGAVVSAAVGFGAADSVCAGGVWDWTGGAGLKFIFPILVLLQAIAWTEYIPSSYGDLKALLHSISEYLGSLIVPLDPSAFLVILNLGELPSVNVFKIVLSTLKFSINFKTASFLLSDKGWLPLWFVELAVPNKSKLTSPPPLSILNTSPKNSLRSWNSVSIFEKNPPTVSFLVSTYSFNEKLGVVVVFKATLFGSEYLNTLLSGLTVV